MSVKCSFGLDICGKYYEWAFLFSLMKWHNFYAVACECIHSIILWLQVYSSACWLFFKYLFSLRLQIYFYYEVSFTFCMQISRKKSWNKFFKSKIKENKKKFCNMPELLDICSIFCARSTVLDVILLIVLKLEFYFTKL